jgi:hypothetical protein
MPFGYGEDLRRRVDGCDGFCDGQACGGFSEDAAAAADV